MSTAESRLAPTPGQTVGPFFGYALPFPHDNELVPHGHPDAVRLHGLVTDGAGPVGLPQLDDRVGYGPAGAVVQEQGSFRRDGWTFTGWGRASTDDNGRYTFSTLMPGAEAGKAAFFAITVFGRGVTNRLFTRAYLPGDEAALQADPLLASLDAEDRSTLVAVADERGFVFDISLQGERETVFLSYPGH